MSKATNRIFIILAFILGITAIISTQFATPTLYGNDGYFHIRLAELIKNSGPIHDFHWARFSIFSIHFADKSFLYHLMLIPFTFVSDIFLGAKLSACFFAILLLFIFFIVLRKYCVQPLIALFILAPLLSYHFISALNIPRPMNFAISLTLLAIYFIIEKRHWGVFIVTVVYCLSHISGPSLLIYVLLAEAVRFFSQRKIHSRSILMVFLGILIGYLIHPNFPNNVLAFYLNGILVPLYAFQGKLEMGTGLLPLTTKWFFLGYPLIVLGLLFLLFLAIFARPRTKLFTQVTFTYSALFIILSFFAARYLVHGYPVFLLFLASYTSDYFQDKSVHKTYLKGKIFPAVSIVTFCIILSLIGWETYRGVRHASADFKRRNSALERTGKWMSRNIPAGELIFHTNWYNGTVFIGLNPQNDYLVCLHPIYMYRAEPKIYHLYRSLSQGRVEDPYYILRSGFQVKYGYAEKGYGLTNQIGQDSRFKILYEDDEGIIFELD
jgi:hypothetical protein